MNLMRPEKKKLKSALKEESKKEQKFAESNKLFLKKKEKTRGFFCYQQVNFIKKLRKDD